MFYCLVKSFVRHVAFANIIRTLEVDFFGGNVHNVFSPPVCMVHFGVWWPFLIVALSFRADVFFFFSLQWKHLYVAVWDAWDSWAVSKELFCSFPFICCWYGHAGSKLRMTLWWELMLCWMSSTAWMSMFVKSIPVLANATERTLLCTYHPAPLSLLACTNSVWHKSTCWFQQIIGCLCGDMSVVLWAK